MTEEQSQSFNLEITNPSSDAVIRYTTDKTEPDSNSTIYSGPIPISETTVVRAALFKPGYTFLFQHQKPIFLIATTVLMYFQW